MGQLILRVWENSASQISHNQAIVLLSCRAGSLSQKSVTKRKFQFSVKLIFFIMIIVVVITYYSFGSWITSSDAQGLLWLQGWGNYRGWCELSWSWPCTRQVPYSLYYHFHSVSVKFKLFPWSGLLLYYYYICFGPHPSMIRVCSALRNYYQQWSGYSMGCQGSNLDQLCTRQLPFVLLLWSQLSSFKGTLNCFLSGTGNSTRVKAMTLHLVVMGFNSPHHPHRVPWAHSLTWSLSIVGCNPQTRENFFLYFFQSFLSLDCIYCLIFCLFGLHYGKLKEGFWSLGIYSTFFAD